MKQHESQTGEAPPSSGSTVASSPFSGLKGTGLHAWVGASEAAWYSGLVRQTLESRLSLLLALVTPLSLMLANENWIITNPLNPPWFDPFVYQSLFMHLREGISNHPDYYPATRIPWIALGAAFYSVLPPIAANLCMKLALLAITVALVFKAMRRLMPAGPAAATIVLLATYPYFVMGAGWDYFDGLIFSLLAACYAGASYGASRPSRWPRAEFTLGAAFAAMLACNLFTVVFAAPLAVFYLGVLLSRQEALSGSGVVKCLLVAALGCAAGVLTGFVTLSALSWLLGGDPLLLKVQIQTALALADPNQNQQWKLNSWAYLLPNATWLALPIATCVVALSVGAVAAFRMVRFGRSRDDVFMLCVALHYLVAFGIFLWSTAATAAVLLFWFYTGYLIVPMFITLGCAFAYVGRERYRLPIWPWALAGAALLGIHSPPVALWLQQSLTHKLHPIASVTTSIWAILAFGLFVLAWRSRLFPLAIPAAAALGMGYLSMMPLPQLFERAREDRVSAFRALLDASEQVAAQSDNPRRYVWIDRTEQPYGGLYHSIWIRTVPLSKNWGVGFEQQNRFPSPPPFGFQVGDPVFIFTTRHDWREAADSHLRQQGLALAAVQPREVSYGSISFQAIHATIAKADPQS